MATVDPPTVYCRRRSDARTVGIGCVSSDFCVDFWRTRTPSVQASESVHLSVEWDCATDTAVEVHMALRKCFAFAGCRLSATVDVL